MKLSPVYTSTLALAAIALAAPATRAQTPVFGNFGVPALSGFSRIVSASTITSFRFVTGSQDVTVSTLDATLLLLTGTSTNMGFGIYSDTAGSPSVQLFDFGTRTFTSSTPANRTFAPGDSFTLLAGTVYHLRTNVVSGNPGWSLTNPSPTNPAAQNGSGIVFQAVRASSNGGETYSDNNTTPRFRLNGTVVVPETGSLALLLPALGVLGTVVAARKHK